MHRWYYCFINIQYASLGLQSRAAGTGYSLHQIIHNLKYTKNEKLNRIPQAVLTQFKYKINICSPLVLLFQLIECMKLYGVYS